jgi:hypothetical protein
VSRGRMKVAVSLSAMHKRHSCLRAGDIAVSFVNGRVEYWRKEMVRAA